MINYNYFWKLNNHAQSTSSIHLRYFGRVFSSHGSIIRVGPCDARGGDREMKRAKEVRGAGRGTFDAAGIGVIRPLRSDEGRL